MEPKIFMARLAVALSLLVTTVGLNGCRRQVTVSQPPPNAPAAGLPSPQQYHQDNGVTLATPQTKFFKGSIGAQLGLQMKLVRNGEQVTGSYHYQRIGATIDLKGTVDKDNNLTLEEYDAGGKQTGVFKGTWMTDEDGLANLAGNWSTPSNEKKTAFSLHEEPIEFSAKVELVAKQIKENNKKLNYQINAEYPQASATIDNQFEKFNQEARNLVNRRLVEFKKNVAQIAKEAVSDPSAEPATDENSGPGNTLEIGYEVALAKDDLISIKFDLGSYSAGAAHPNSSSTVLNYDVKGSKVLKLSDLFNPGSKYLKAISSYCIKDLKRQSKSKSGLLEDEQIQSGAGPDPRNYQSWTITRKGLEITFDAYQVAAYAAGPQSVLVPYSALKEFIRIDGPLLQFVK